MKAYIRYVIYNVRSSFWFIPFLLLGFAIVLTEIATRLDRSFGNEILDNVPWLVRVNAEGAQALVTTIAGSIITVTSLVFSLTLVALTVASSQLGPRLLVMFMRDRFVQFVLGSFVATFVFSLLIIRTIRAIDDAIFVPHLSVNVALVLAIVSFGLLIMFIHHVATAIQADAVIAKVRVDMDRSLAGLLDRAESERSLKTNGHIQGDFPESSKSVYPAQSGYIQTIDHDALLNFAIKTDSVVRIERRPGHFVLKEERIASIAQPRNGDDTLREKVQAAVVLGNKRTMAQDIEFAFSSLVEIALRALSSGINDSHTALACIDQLTAGLAAAIGRLPTKALLYDNNGHIRVQLDVITFEGLIDGSFNEIRQNCGPNISALIRLLESLGRLTLLVRDAEQISAVRKHRDMIDRAAKSAIQEKNDLADLANRLIELDGRLEERERVLASGQVGATSR